MVSPNIRRRWTRVYALLAALLIVLSLWGAREIVSQVGALFTGVIWTQTPRHHLVLVDVYTPSSWPGMRHGLQGGDRLVAVNERPPSALYTVLAALSPGDTLVITVERCGRLVHLLIPTYRFSWSHLFVPYVLAEIAGIIALLAGYWLVSTARELPSLLLGYILLAMAMATLSVLQKQDITRSYHNLWVHILAFVPAYPLLGALLAHLTLVYPSPHRLLRTHPSLPKGIYAVATGIAFILAMALWLESPYGPWVFRAVAVFVCGGLIGVIGRSALDFLRPPSKRTQPTHSIAAALCIGFGLMVSLGFIPPLTHGMPEVVTHLVLPLLAAYPLVLAYAVKHTELVGELQRQMEYYRDLESQAREAHRMQEHALHEIADTLHDAIVSDLRGLQLWLAGLRGMQKTENYDLSAEEMNFLEKAVAQLYIRARAIMEGAKPVDFSQQDLRGALRYLVKRAQRGNPHLDIMLHVSLDEEATTPSIRETAYWIVHSALNNIMQHAHATRVEIDVRTEDHHMFITVRDDGQGFDVQWALSNSLDGERHHLGIRNMYTRARRLGGDAHIESGPAGTTVRVWLPLKEEDNGYSRVNSGR